MNYYEELGIQRDATLAEIREAYKLAARLLHPDLQRDRRLKELAERQMQRLSDVVGTLASPRQRARYDADLISDTAAPRLAPPAPQRWPELWRTAARHWFWILLGAMTIGMGVWYGSARGTDTAPLPAAPERARLPVAPVKTRRDPGPGKGARAKIAAVATGPRPEREAPQPGKAGADSAVPAIAARPTEEDAPFERPTGNMLLPPTAAPPVDAARKPDESRFAGEWLYAADGKDEDRAGAYPAKYVARYVEFRLRQESGVLAGQYRAVHRLFDKAISPEIVFRVRGELPTGNTGKLDWESSTGARGELELTLSSPDQLQVKWWTTQFGKREALGSGMAMLTRLMGP